VQDARFHGLGPTAYLSSIADVGIKGCSNLNKQSTPVTVTFIPKTRL
jgi:hypothetical protein